MKIRITLKKVLLTNMFLLTYVSLLSQTLTEIKILPSTLNEISGIIKLTNTSFWCHNDGGNAAFLYELDELGNITDSIFLDSINNVDFEDITKDQSNNIYIADVGNNNFNRTNLVIYKINDPTSLVKDSVVPQKIFISYLDQTTFPDTNQNVDCEAIIHYNNFLYLFTKNWSGSNMTKVYKVPDTAGSYILSPIDSMVFNGFITGADILNDTLAILQMGAIDLFHSFNQDNFFQGTKETFSFALSQKEGVCFINNNCLYITQENHNFFPDPKLFSLKLSLANIKENTATKDIRVFPNPASNTLKIATKNNNKTSQLTSISIIDALGNIISKNRGYNITSINIQQLLVGTYTIRVSSAGKTINKTFIKQ